MAGATRMGTKALKSAGRALPLRFTAGSRLPELHPPSFDLDPAGQQRPLSVIPAAGAIFYPCITYHASMGVSGNGLSAGHRFS